ncbi:hypothetical protein CHELA1G11_12831 [Hyphomicrobiales bacterium]|nr:hypothetical protein CHELA1G2_11478 [Hyphomicrobiales bacterium]CAH1667426.1 hypothetical protein CHELA1G11_12831 [Hyphomicrobiales bacterium]
MKDFENSDQAIDRLRATLINKIPEQSIRESQHYSDHDEYALALEMLLCGAHQSKIIMDDEQKYILKYLSSVINIIEYIDPEYWSYFKELG